MPTAFTTFYESCPVLRAETPELRASRLSLCFATRRVLAPYLKDPWMAWGGLAAIVLLLLAWSPTPATRNWVTVTLLTASAALGLEVLRRQTAREFPDAERGQASFSLPGRGKDSQPTPSVEDMRLEHLTRLGELRASGVIDEAEFVREKERLLSGAAS